MRAVTLTRLATGEQGTFGLLEAGELSLHTAELPERGNRCNVSCIPAGEYPCRVVRSPRFGRVYHVLDVPGRSGVLIHGGNLAGDEERGWLTHSHGCILPGLRSGRLGDQLAVLCSRPALGRLMAALDGAPFNLIITEAFRHA
ncbi:DUF5675 family protein [Desulfocurvus sp. DL9XJH121]